MSDRITPKHAIRGNNDGAHGENDSYTIQGRCVAATCVILFIR